MPSGTAFDDVTDNWDALSTLLDQDGSRNATAIARLTDARAPLRDVADALHCLCLLHGNRPGPIDTAHDRAVSPLEKAWLQEAADGFSAERDWLIRLVAAAGPVPATANQTASENTIAGQHHALEMLVLSERPGCALGAAAALVMDWHELRRWLDQVGERFGLIAPMCRLPGMDVSRTLLLNAPMKASQARAFYFGAQQMLAQQRGLWALVDARAEARAAQ